MPTNAGRRSALHPLCIGLAAGAAGLATTRPRIARVIETMPAGPSLLPPGAGTLRELITRLSRAPRRRDFKTVPMILTQPDHWDHEALTEVLPYKSPHKQAWDMTEIEGPWAEPDARCP